MKIRTLIVDDEPLGRQRLLSLLEGDPDIEILGECGDGKQALCKFRQLRPDLVFLDIQMPLLDGFGVLAEMAGPDLPAVIFVTAYDSYALKAFEVHAVDYLLKPFDKSRFEAALARAKNQLQQGRAGAMDERLRDLWHAVGKRHRGPERLIVRSGGRVTFVRLEDIDWIEAAANYARLHVGLETHLLRESMSGLEAKLEPNNFARIHRSTIVNIDRIKELQPAFNGDYVIILRDGTELALSRGYRGKLEEAMGLKL